MTTQSNSIKASDAYRRWNSTLYQVQVAIATGDLAAYTAAQAKRQEALADLQQIEEASFVSDDAVRSLDASLM